MSLYLFNVYMVAVMKEVKMGMERSGMRFLDGWERVEITWPLCMKMTWFCVVSRYHERLFKEKRSGCQASKENFFFSSFF